MPVRLLLGCLFVWSTGAAATTFTNPLFTSADPWVTYDRGTYYYSEAGCDGKRDICVRAAGSLLGLKDARSIVVWAASDPAEPDGDEIWAPEIHKVNGHWFIYYSADANHDNNGHRLFVLRAKTDDPLGAYCEGNTGAAHGGLPQANVHWAIDPNVFIGADGKLYLTWSCTNFTDSRFPQQLCLARMRDAEHIDGAPVVIATPTEPWERRGDAIEEGPVGYVRAGHTFITYSGSSSWIPNDYAVGLLENDGRDLLGTNNWSKSGPIFDHHGTTYGPGSVVFASSDDGKQDWVLYHAIDRLDCKPAYVCRDIRMQPMSYAPDGSPLLGFPYNPGVPVSPWTPGRWGAAWGDAVEGSEGGRERGAWTVSGDHLTLQRADAGWNQTFRRTNPNLSSFRAVADVQVLSATGTPGDSLQYGMYCLYDDEANHAEVLLDPGRGMLLTRGVVKGEGQPALETALPPGFNANDSHHLECTKSGDLFTVWLDGSPTVRQFSLDTGQWGVLSRGALLTYRVP